MGEDGKTGVVKRAYGAPCLVWFDQLRFGQRPREGLHRGAGSRCPFPPARQEDRLESAPPEGGRRLRAKSWTAADVEMGFEVSKGRYVKFNGKSSTSCVRRRPSSIEVNEFVALDEIDPIYYERTYWLAPDGEGAAKAYQLPARGDGGARASRNRQRRHAQQAISRGHSSSRRSAGHVDDAFRRRGRSAQRGRRSCRAGAPNPIRRRSGWRPS